MTDRQTLVIAGWHPTSSPNNQKRHWRTVQKNHHIDRDTAWAAAMQAGWKFVPGKVRLTITFVCATNRRRDADNLVARCKGVIDGLKAQEARSIAGLRFASSKLGFFEDDDTAHLDLVVRADVRPGVKQLEITLEPVD
jgi:hypothetical protein